MATVHIDKNIGVSGGKVHWMRFQDGKEWWCRKAIAIMGSFNMPNDQALTISPFAPEFHDNYVEGKGKTKEEALEMMEKEEKGIADSLWI